MASVLPRGNTSSTTPDRLTRSQMVALAAILPNPLKWSPVRPNRTVLRKIRRVERLSAQAPFPKDNCGKNSQALTLTRTAMRQWWPTASAKSASFSLE